MNFNESLKFVADFIGGADINTVIALFAAVATLILAYISYRVLRQSNDINQRLLKLESSRNKPELVISKEIVFDKDGFSYFLLKNVGGMTAYIEEVVLSNNIDELPKSLTLERKILTPYTKTKKEISMNYEQLERIDRFLIEVRYRNGKNENCACHDDRFLFIIDKKKPNGTLLFLFKEKGPKEEPCSDD